MNISYIMLNACIFSAVFHSPHNRASFSEPWKTSILSFLYLCVNAHIDFHNQQCLDLLSQHWLCKENVFSLQKSQPDLRDRCRLSCHIYTLSISDGVVFSCCSPKPTVKYLMHNALPSVEIQPLAFSLALWVSWEFAYQAYFTWIVSNITNLTTHVFG